MNPEIIRQFLGELPIIESQLLPIGAASKAINTKLTSGVIEPWRSPSLTVVPSKAGLKKTIYRFGEATGNDTQYWFTFTTDVDIIRAAIDGDVSERTFYTGDGVPKKTDNALALAGGTNYPNNAYKMGVPAPIVTITGYSAQGIARDPASIATSVAYVVTYVTAWGEEGRPSKPVGPLDFRAGQSVDLTDLPGPPSGNYNITGIRLYRSNTGATGTTYQFVADIPIGTTFYSDTKASSALGETVITFGWDEPPDDGFGLTLGANGNAMMFSGKTIYPCVPSIYYAYPPENQLSCASLIVGAGSFGQSFAILTKSNPYIVSGVDPRTYSQVKIGQDKGCVSKRSIVEMMGGVIYAAKDGLWMVNDSGLHPMTDKMMSEDQFKALKPESIHAAQLEGRYYLFYDNGQKQGLMIFDFARSTFIVESDVYADSTYYDPLQGALYLAQAGGIYRWDGGGAMQMTWKSKEYRLAWYGNPGYAKVEAEGYPVTFRFYSNGILKYTKVVNDKLPFRLPTTESTTYSVEVTSGYKVRAIGISELGDEIVSL